MTEKDAIKQKSVSTDLTFFTNEPDATLLDRFKITIANNTRFFDVLVGYFRTSGFYHPYNALDDIVFDILGLPEDVYWAV